MLTNRGQYIPMPVITHTDQLAALKCGQWVKLAWCDQPSRFYRWTRFSVTAFHGPKNAFVDYVKAMKAADAFAAFNRHARNLSKAA